MAAKARTTRRSGPRKSRSRRAAAKPPELQGLIAGLIAQVEAGLRGLDVRLAACERRQDNTVAALAAVMEGLQSRADETQVGLYDLRAAVEPLRMAAAAASPDEIARQADYLKLVAKIRSAVRAVVPRTARVLVVSRGDEELLQLFGRTAGHFPQDAGGDFAGEYPADGTAAVAALERLVAAGWNQLVIPATSAWWLDHYREFRMHLSRAWHAVHRDTDTCTIFALDPARPGPWHDLDAFVADFRRSESRSPAMLDWETASDLAGFFAGCAVFPPVDRGVGSLPYLERSIDIVAVPWGDAARRAEARRIASAAVVEIAAPGIAGPGFRVAVERLGRHAPQSERAAAPGRVGVIAPVLRPGPTARP